MGLIFSRFRKPGDSPSTKLEFINKELAEIENYRRQNLALQKKTVASLVIYSILLYLVASILYFVYYFPILSLRDKFLHSLPLLLFPIIIFGIKKFLHWYFVKRITENDLKLADLKEQKNKIIEDVMENETYKKATEILEKYAPSRLNKLNESNNSACGTPDVTQSILQSPGTELRQRAGVAPQSVVRPAPSAAPTPGAAFNRTIQGATPAINTPGSKVTMQQRSLYGAPPGPPLPRQVLPRDRSYMDKIFESLVGDGPQNRFALICRHCKSHNGMAMPEEFEFLSFRCCYCFHMNEARKSRPNAPRLNLDTTIGSSSEDVGDDLSTDDDLSDDEGEVPMETEAIGESADNNLPSRTLPAAYGESSKPKNNGDKKAD